MCIGGGSAPEAKQSPQEITAAKQAVSKYNERQEDGYVGLEQDAITDSNIDHKEALRGVNSAELADQESQAYSLAAATRRGLDFGGIGAATGQSISAMETNSQKNALTLQDQKKLGVINTGQDKANNTAGAVMANAENGSKSSLSDLKAEWTRMEGKYKAIGQVIETSMAVAGYSAGQSKKSGKKPEVIDATPSYINPNSLDYDNINGARSNPYGMYSPSGRRSV